MFKNLMAALVAVFVVCLAATATAQARWESDMTEGEETCKDCGTKARALESCKTYVDKYCPADTSFAAAGGTAPAPKPKAPPPPPPPAAKPPAPPTPAPPPPPPKEWTCKGFGHAPEKAKTADGCTCVGTDKKQPSTTHSPVIGAADHTVWCVLKTQAPEFKQAIDWIAELQDATLFDPKKHPDRPAKVKRVRELLLKIDMMNAGGISDPSSAAALSALKPQISGLEDRLDAVLQSQCDIENPKDPKWTAGAIQLQCDAHIREKARGEAIKVVPRANLMPAIAVVSGPAGPQVLGEVSVLHEFGMRSPRFRLVSGATFCATIAAPRTGGQGCVWPKIGLRYYAGSPLQSNTFAFDMLFGGRQLISSYGHNPTFEGVRYDASQLWGTFATWELNLHIVTNSWLHVGFGAWVEYGWRVNSYPKSPRAAAKLEEKNGFGGGGRMFAEFVF